MTSLKSAPRPTQCSKLPLELKPVSVSPGKLVGTHFKRVDLIDKGSGLDPKQMTLPFLLTTPLSNHQVPWWWSDRKYSQLSGLLPKRVCMMRQCQAREAEILEKPRDGGIQPFPAASNPGFHTPVLFCEGGKRPCRPDCFC